MSTTSTCKLILFFASSILVLVSVVSYYKIENTVIKFKELDNWHKNRIANMNRLQMKTAHLCGLKFSINYETNNIIHGNKPLSYYITKRNNTSLLVLRIPQKYCSECNAELYNIMIASSTELVDNTLIIVPKHLHRDFYAKFIGSGYEHRIVSVANQLHSFDIKDEINPYFFTVKHNNIASSYFIYNRNEVEQATQYIESYLIALSN